MTDDSRLQMHPDVEVKKMGRRPLYLLAVVGVALALYLTDSMDNAPAPTPMPEKEEPAPARQAPLLPDTDAPSGVLGTPKDAPEDKRDKRDDAKEEDPSIRITVQVPENETRTMEQQLRQVEAYQQQRAAAALAALSAPMGVQALKSETISPAQGAAYSLPSGVPVSVEGIGADAADPARQTARDREEFLSRARQDEWSSPHTRKAGRPYELQTGTVIPGVLLTGINSDLPGALIGQVSQNVFDSATGRSLLVPKGSRLYGVYDSRVAMGQRRVLIAWQRVIFPDGSSVTLEAMPGASRDGMAGFQDQIDNHTLRIFGNAILMSLITGGMAYSLDTLDNSDSSDDKPSLQNEMGSALATQLGQASLQLLQQHMNLSPTLQIRPGYQFNIVLTRDLAFEAPYAQ